MAFEQETILNEKISKDSLVGWYKSSERCNHPHPKKLKVECSLDEDIVEWLKEKTNEDEEYSLYINYYLRKIKDKGFEKNLQ